MTTVPAPRSRRYRGVDEDQRRADRRGRLVEAAIELFGTHGYHATTVRQVCAAAGLTERYFYEGFANSEDLLGAAYMSVTDDLQAAMRAELAAAGPGIEAQGRACLKPYFDLVASRRPAARLILIEVLGVSPAIDRLYRRTVDGFARLLLRAALGEGGSDAPLPEGALLVHGHGLVGAFVQIASVWLIEGGTRPLADHLEDSVALFRAVGGTVRRR